MAADFRRLIEALAGHKVDYVIIGGVALVLHGSARVTQDLDICYARTPANLAALAAALAGFRPTLRGAPPDLPFRLDPPTLKSGLNFTLSSDAGDIDLLGEVTGVGGYDALAASAKRAAGRLKDLADLAEILEIRKVRGR